MKKAINEKLIKRNKIIGNITSIGGIAILAAGLFINMKPTPIRTMISFGALIVGFIVAQISTNYVSRFGRSPRFDEIIANNLDKLSHQYTFHIYSGPVPMLLVGPSGLWIPIPLVAGGEITYDKKWRQHGGSFFMKMFGQENIGKPEIEVASNEKQVLDFLKNHLEDVEIPPINSVLIAINPKAVIGDVENAPVPLVETSGLRRYIRKADRKMESEISPAVLDKINSALIGERAEIIVS